MASAPPQKGGDVVEALEQVRRAFPDIRSFERAFPSLCFALATGVGKTRLMGAFITYLHLAHGIRNFLVLAPNLTIYDKLVADFTPHTPKYVFQGIAEFAVKAPTLVTGENYEQKPQVLDLFERDDVVVNIFNIAKFNTRADDARKMRRLSEFLGQSYFDHLAGLDDLVLIMDEAHRYRADTTMASLDELKPLLGLELTATPQVEAGTRSRRFQNVLYDYPLSQAMKDGYVKEPAVATRQDFDVGALGGPELERLKLEDGIRLHESVKVDLEVYAHQHGVRRVKPFMLVIAEDTAHANDLVQVLEDEQFFDGRYKGRVIQVHSSQRGAEKDDNVARLLAVENPDEPTEIVVHVNMLKEGWDVTNLYTIVPLRAANSRTLVEQSIGRGLRLPYGQRTGVAAVDRLTIVAHDRFQEIADEARRGGYSFNTVKLDADDAAEPKQPFVAPPVLETALGIGPSSVAAGFAPTVAGGAAVSPPAPLFTKPEEVAAAQATLSAIVRLTRDPALVPGPKALQSAAVQQKLVAEVVEQRQSGQLSLHPTLSDEALLRVVRDATAAFIQKTIGIPRIVVLPNGTVQAGFHDFDLELSAVRFQPMSREILVQHLNSETRQVIGFQHDGTVESRLEDYIVRGLVDFDDVDYDAQADLLYKLAGQVVAHLRAYLVDDAKVRNVLQYHQRALVDLVHAQMQKHAWVEATSFDVVVTRGFTEARPQAFAAPAGAPVRHFATPVPDPIHIRKMLFGGFGKCLYDVQKFQSDPERRFAGLLERDASVLKWFKPGSGVFQIRYTPSEDYEPDFVVETDSEKLLCEVKREDEMTDPVVRAKARAAALWCRHAKAHETAHDGKPWRYLLVPDTAVLDNASVAGLAAKFTLGPEEN
jgi:type III restriction enzyme